MIDRRRLYSLGALNSAYFFILHYVTTRFPRFIALVLNRFFFWSVKIRPCFGITRQIVIITALNIFVGALGNQGGLNETVALYC